jgi:hypothetical protein
MFDGSADDSLLHVVLLHVLLYTPGISQECPQ